MIDSHFERKPNWVCDFCVATEKKKKNHTSNKKYLLIYRKKRIEIFFNFFLHYENNPVHSSLNLKYALMLSGTSQMVEKKIEMKNQDFIESFFINLIWKEGAKLKWAGKFLTYYIAPLMQHRHSSKFAIFSGEHFKGLNLL